MGWSPYRLSYNIFLEIITELTIKSIIFKRYVYITQYSLQATHKFYPLPPLPPPPPAPPIHVGEVNIFTGGGGEQNPHLDEVSGGGLGILVSSGELP